MEKRQTVEFLEYLRQDRNLEGTIYRDALNMAIDALKAQLSQQGTTSDLISRQAVINAIENTNAKMSMPEWDEITNAVMSLPTIQPVATDTNDGDTISRQAAIDAFEDTTFTKNEIRRRLSDLPPAQPEPQWIPVSERLPRDGTWNIFTDGKNISVERYKADAIDHFFPNGRWFQFEDVIAWMPLPELYKPNK